MKLRELFESAKPVDKALNAAIFRMAHILMPAGYDVSEQAPNSFEELAAHYKKTKRILVWSGASDNTIFGDEEVNWAFRAWHDWVHLTQNFPFTTAGEAAACHFQIAQLKKVYGDSQETERWAAIIIAEVKEQTEYFEHTGNFVDDQRAFNLHDLHSKGHYLDVTENMKSY